MAREFNPPPNWPQPPAGFKPGPGWKPNPAWGPPPSGWELWVDPQERSSKFNVFISYRRSDCQSQANALLDGLTHRLKYAEIFMDIDAIPAGVDFEQHIREAIDSSDVVLVLIGDNWLDTRPGTDIRRIDEPEDFVRLEIENALSSPDLRVIPVLVEGARMPDPASLPESIRRLAKINAIDLDDLRWKDDIVKLTKLLDGIHEQRKSGRPLGGIHATQVATVVRQAQPQPRPPAPRASTPAPPPPPPPTPTYAPPSRAAVASPPTAAPQLSKWSQFNKNPATGWLLALAPITCCGLFNFVPALRAGLLRPHRPQARWTLFGIGAALEVLAFVGFALVGSGPEDEDGTPTGATSDFGMIVLFASIFASVAVGLIYHKRPPELDAIETEMARRRTRDHYRELARDNPSMARDIRIGRPDLQRSLDDAGLVDLNTIGAQALVDHAHIPRDEAHRLVEQRSIAGRFRDVEHAIDVTEVSQTTADHLREIGVVT